MFSTPQQLDRIWTVTGITGDVVQVAFETRAAAHEACESSS